MIIVYTNHYKNTKYQSLAHSFSAMLLLLIYRSNLKYSTSFRPLLI
jgi:hypothetical protein